MGFNVIVYDAFEKGLEASKKFHKQFAELFSSTRGASKEDIDATLSRLSYTTNLANAVLFCARRERSQKPILIISGLRN